ncbi:MAG: sulfatase-like hydrolase/transferase [Candidatus Rhabdochlamydia sp.]
MKPSFPLNLRYFGTFFLTLLAISWLHIGTIGYPCLKTSVLYGLHACYQLGVQWLCLMMITGWLVQKKQHSLAHCTAILSLMIFLFQVIEFPLMRFMDLSIQTASYLYLNESWPNLIEFLRSSHISLTKWSLIAAACLLFIGLGGYGFRWTQYQWQQRVSFHRIKQGVMCLAALALFLAGYEFLGKGPIQEKLLLQALPWKQTWIKKNPPRFCIRQERLSVQNPTSEEKPLKPVRLPNIYLFIIESLREDFITPQIAPDLHAFKSQNSAALTSVAAANGTPLSWYSIFHSLYPFRWNTSHPMNTLGSLPLSHLKKAGYKIEVISSSQLKFYQMDEVIFGQERYLADEYHVFPDHSDEDSYLHDQAAFDLLLKKMSLVEEGHLFIIFLESTHFDYSAPLQDEHNGKINYVKLLTTPRSVEQVKSRYQTSISYINQQMKRFFDQLQHHERQEEAVVVITSDHGEEFFEEGRLFHASHLNRFQTHIPLYFRLGSDSQQLHPQIASHVDLFPSLLHHIFGPAAALDRYHGTALQQQRGEDHYRLSARYHAGYSPVEFLITTPVDRLVFKVMSRDLNFCYIEVISWKDQSENPLTLDLDLIQQRYQPVFNRFFTPAFP